MAFCSNCGSELAVDKNNCPNCGTLAVQYSGRPQSGSAEAIKGLLHVLGTFFTLPIYFAKWEYENLKTIHIKENRKANSDIPFLSWIHKFGKVSILAIAALVILIPTLVSSLKFIYEVFSALSALLKGIEGYDYKSMVVAFFGLPASIIMGAISAFIWIWMSNFFLELMFQIILISNNVKTITVSKVRGEN